MAKAEISRAAGEPVRLPAASRRFARFAWWVLVYNLAVVLWGAYVRATGSGAGCGNHWPFCNGQLMPHSPSWNTIVEFSHRISSGVDVVLVATLVVWAFRAVPKRHPARRGAVLSAIFLFTEALLGAALVLLQHVAKNASVARAYSLSAHLINTLTLLACLALTAWWAMGEPDLQLRGKPVWKVAVSLGAILLVGVSGAIAALGDTLFPARSLAAGFAQDFDPAANIFLRLRLLHPVLAVSAGMWLIFMASMVAARIPRARRLAWTLLSLVLLQVLGGFLNLLLLAPVWMQLVHLLLADLLWISLVLLSARVLAAEPKG